jgi:outer membrane protein TolC
MAGIAGYVLAADPAPAGATKAAPPASKDELRAQRIEKWRNEMDRMEQQIAKIEAERQRYILRQKDIRDEIIKTCGLSPENVLPLLLASEKERFALESQVMLKSMRRDGIERMIGGATNATERRTGSDVVLRHLEKIVAVRKAALDRAQSLQKKNAIPESDVQQAEADLAEAQIRAELRREELAKSPADAETGRLAQQVHELRLDVAQDELQARILDEKLAALKKARDMLDRYNEITELKMPAFSRQFQELQIRLMQGQIDEP